jgi:hypothetical protein
MPVVRQSRTRSQEPAANAPLSRASRPHYYRMFEGADLGAPFKKVYEDNFISEVRPTYLHIQYKHVAEQIFCSSLKLLTNAGFVRQKIDVHHG